MGVNVGIHNMCFWLSLVCAAAFSGLAIPALAEAVPAGEAPRFGGEIRVALTSDIRSTNPGVRRDGNTDAVLYHVAEALVAFGDDLRPAPMLADAVTVSDDGLTYDFTLRRGVRFHNGAEMTSAHVVWSWQRLLKAETGYRCRADFDGSGPTGLRITEVRADGPYRVAYALNQRCSLFLHRMASIQCLSAILHPSSVDAAGDWVAPVGTGPYRISAWRHGQDITLTRFEGYSARDDAPNGLTGAKVAYLDRIDFRIVPDRIAAKSALYAGNIDLVFALPLSAAAEVERRAATKGDVQVYHQETLDWAVVLMQTQDPLLSDARMRRAIAHAVSPSMVTTFATFGYAQPNPSAVQRLSNHYGAVQRQWPDYDPEKARRLAQEAGYAGQPIVIQANRKYSYMFDNAVAIQAMLHAAGFNARIELFDWATQLTNFFRGDFQLSSFGYSARSHPGLVYGNIIGSKQFRKTAQWDDVRAFEQLAAIEAATTEAEMQALLDGLHRRALVQMPVIGLYNDHIVDIAAAGIRGYAPWAFARPRLWNVWLAPDQAEETP
jgi:peptide/nickel transport system substrate-binding protein